MFKDERDLYFLDSIRLILIILLKSEFSLILVLALIRWDKRHHLNLFRSYSLLGMAYRSFNFLPTMNKVP